MINGRALLANLARMHLAAGGALEDAAALARGALLAAHGGMSAGDAGRVHADVAGALLDIHPRRRQPPPSRAYPSPRHSKRKRRASALL